jgi:lysophospholipase L1-like esterase
VKLWLFAFILIFAGCKMSSQAKGEQALAVLKTQSSTSSPLRFLALGDSYTIGEGVAEAKRWPVQLADAFNAQGIPLGQPEIIARTGWTTGELAKAIDAAQIQPPYQLVSLSIGVNNQYRGYSQEEYRKEFTGLLNRAIAFAGDEPGRVLVISIPDWSVTPYAERFDREVVSEEIDAFNKINRQETERLGARYIDITAISRRAGQELDYLAVDGLHPSGEMYAKWVKAIQPSARAALDVKD